MGQDSILPDIDVQGMAANEKALWVRTAKDLLRFDLKTYLWEKNTLTDEEVEKIFSERDADGTMLQKGLDTLIKIIGEYETYDTTGNKNSIWLRSGGDLLRFDQVMGEWTLVALPFHIHPIEVGQPGGDGVCIGDTVVMGDILWFIERDHCDTRFGLLKRLALGKGDVDVMDTLPWMGWLHSDGRDVLAVSTDQAFVFGNVSDPYTCHALGYDFNEFDREITAFKGAEAVDKVLPRPDMPVHICASYFDQENIWIAAKRFRSPADRSNQYTLIGGGLFRFDRKARKWHWALKAKDLGEADITYIGGCGEGLFLGTEYRLHIYDTSDGKIKQALTRDDGLLHAEVRLCRELCDGIWTASYHGYTIYNKKDGTMTKYREPMKNKFIRQRFCKDTKAWEDDQEVVAFEPPYHDVYAILDLETCTLFGTSQGLYKYYKENDGWMHCGLRDGLSSQRVFSISRWEGHIIVGTNNGLFVFPYGSV